MTSTMPPSLRRGLVGGFLVIAFFGSITLFLGPREISYSATMAAVKSFDMPRGISPSESTWGGDHVALLSAPKEETAQEADVFLHRVRRGKSSNDKNKNSPSDAKSEKESDKETPEKDSHKEEAGSHEDKPPVKVTNSQLVLLIVYVWTLMWVGFWELVTLIRTFLGLEPYVVRNPYVAHAAVVDGGESGKGPGGDNEGEDKKPVAVAVAHVKPEGATTFVPQFSFFEYSQESQQVGRGAVLFGTLVLLFYIVDGPYSYHGPDNRVYDRDLFMFVCSVIAVMGFLTIRDTHKKNSTILNREQTEEWKGYMQIGFVLYHYFAAKETYNLIRIFIAAYVWMTGFGNFSYFWFKKDYSFVRLAKMLIRLNWLVFFICLVMDKEYMLYYVCPLHTFYFMVVYTTMAIFPEKNYEPFWMRLKFLFLFLFLFVLFEVPGVFEAFFWPLKWVLGYEDSLHEWQFRATLDHYAAWVGMIYAYNYPAIEAMLKRVEQSGPAVRYGIKAVITGIALGAMVLWMWYYVPMDKYLYNALHPYVAVIPYTAYIILRNISARNRGWVLVSLTLSPFSSGWLSKHVNLFFFFLFSGILADYGSLSVVWTDHTGDLHCAVSPVAGERREGQADLH